jgi:hypothetical protein
MADYTNINTYFIHRWPTIFLVTWVVPGDLPTDFLKKIHVTDMYEYENPSSWRFCNLRTIKNANT